MYDILSFASARFLSIFLGRYFFVLFEYNANKFSPKPNFRSLSFTALNTICFPATKSIFLPLFTLWIIMFVIICDFPVPAVREVQNYFSK